MPTIQEMLEVIIDDANGNQSEAARRIGLSKAYISNIVKGHRATSRGTDELIAKAFEKVGKVTKGSNATVLPRSTLFKIPLVSWARAGEGRDYQDLCAQMEEEIESTCSDENAFAVEIEGKSMSPKFEPGEKIVINPNGTIRDGKPVLIRDIDGKTYFKLYREIGPDEVELVSINEAWPPMRLKRDQIKWIYPAWGRIEEF